MSPYWVYQQVPVDEIESYLRRWCKRVVTATEGQDVQSLAWIQAFSVPAGREAEIERGMEIMREEGIEVICAWSYRACEAMSKIAPDNPALNERTSEEFPLRLNTGRVRDQWHTMTRTGLSPRLGSHLPEPYVEVHPGDAEQFNLEEGSFARLSSRHGDV